MDKRFSPYALRASIAISLTLIACVTLIVLLKVPGLFISALLAAAVWLMASAQPMKSEHAALRTSIQLSAEDLRDVMAEFEKFESATDPDTLADRTLHRPALLDLDLSDEDIEAFHFQYAASARFLRRLPSRLNNPMLSTQQLEHLLTITDQRASELQESWLAARKAAFKLGPNYKNNSENPAA